MAASSHITRACRSVLMVGTSLGVRGGISAVVRGYRDAGLFQRVSLRYVATHVDGSWRAKLVAALGGYVRMIAELIRMDAPLVHVHFASRASFWRKSVICLLALLWKRPYVLHLHGGEFGKFYDEECGGFAKWLARTLLTRAALVLALAELWRVTLTRIAPQARVRVLYNSVPIPGRPPRAVSAADAERILYSGRLSARKGTFDLITAFARISAQFPHARLICAGDGDVPAATQLAGELGVEERVSFSGWIGPEAMRRELSSATIFALPSYAEGMPMALLEAMSWGVAVLSCPVGGIPEVITPDYDGLLVNPGDVGGIERALVKLLGSPTARARLGNAARNTVIERFSQDLAVDTLVAVYREFGIEDRDERRKRAVATGAGTTG